MSESDTVRNVRLALSNGDARLFRNNVGTAWRGRVVKQSRTMLLIENPQIVNFGLCTGSSDLIGWRSMLIAPEMVGQRVYLARAAAPRAADRLDRVPLFLEPRAERWTLMWVESIASSSGMPPVAARFSKILRQTPWMLQRLKRLKTVVLGP